MLIQGNSTAKSAAAFKIELPRETTVRLPRYVSHPVEYLLTVPLGKRKRSESVREKLCEHYLVAIDTRSQAVQQSMPDQWFHSPSSIPVQEPLSPQSPLNTPETLGARNGRFPCPNYLASTDRSQSDSMLSSPHTQSTEGAQRTPPSSNTWYDDDVSRRVSRPMDAQLLQHSGRSVDLVTGGSDFGLNLKGMEPEASRITMASQPESSGISIVADALFARREHMSPAQVDFDFHDQNTFDHAGRAYPHNNGSDYTTTPSIPTISKASSVEGNQHSLTGKTALHLSAENGHESVVRCLLEYGSDIDARDSSGATALHYAAEMGNVDVIEALLERGGDGDAKDQQGQTPLHMAAKNGHEAAVRILVQFGVRVDI